MYTFNHFYSSLFVSNYFTYSQSGLRIVEIVMISKGTTNACFRLNWFGLRCCLCRVEYSLSVCCCAPSRQCLIGESRHRDQLIDRPTGYSSLPYFSWEFNRFGGLDSPPWGCLARVFPPVSTAVVIVCPFAWPMHRDASVCVSNMVATSPELVPWEGNGPAKMSSQVNILVVIHKSSDRRVA